MAFGGALSDDRMAFVIETEAKLDAIKAARSEVVGLKADTEGMGISSIAATRNMGFFSAVTAEANAHLGEHSLGLSRVERVMASSAGQALGLNRVMEVLGATSLKFGVGDIYTIAIIGGLAAITYGIDQVTKSSTEAIDKAEKLNKHYLELARISALGIGGKFKADIEDIAKGAEAAGERVGFLLRAQMALRGTGLDLLLGHFVDKYSGEVADAGKATLEAKKDLNKEIAKVDEEQERKAEAHLNKLIAIATKAGTPAERAAFEAYKREEKAAELHLQNLALIAEKQVTAIGFPLIAEGMALEAAHARRLREIAASKDSAETKLQAERDADALLVAERADLNRRIALENDRADKEDEKRTEERIKKQQQAEKKRAAVLLLAVDAYVKGSESLQKTLIRLALDPLIKELEGTAVRQFVRAAASAAALDFAGAARHAGAGALALAGAREIAQLGGLGGGSAGGGSGGSSGGGGSSSTTFEPRVSGGAAGVMGLTIITQNSLGADHIQNLSFELNRAGILKRPIVQLPPTSGITVSAG